MTETTAQTDAEVPPLVDAHCHLDALDTLALAPQWREVGVGTVVVAGVRPSRWPAQREAMAAVAPWLDAYATIGLHPYEAAAVEELHHLDTLLQSPQVGLCALGEIGLDTQRGPELDVQLRVFRHQLDLARQLDLPAVLHVVGAHTDVWRVLRADGCPGRGVMLHGFVGSAEIADGYLRVGAMLSVGGPVTWRMSTRRLAGIRAIPDDALLVETDAPDQPISCQPRRHGTPGDLPTILNHLARVRGADRVSLAQTTIANAHRFFNLDR